MSANDTAGAFAGEGIIKLLIQMIDYVMFINYK